MLGERGLWYKMTFYERAVRVPLLFAGPGIKPRRRISEAVSHLDLLPTLGGLTGARVDRSDLDGRDLSPALKGGALKQGDVIGEYMGEGYDAPVVMIRRGGAQVRPFRHRRSASSTTSQAIRSELRNLALEPAHRGAVEALVEEAEGRWDFERITGGGHRQPEAAARDSRRPDHRADRALGLRSEERCGGRLLPEL